MTTDLEAREAQTLDALFAAARERQARHGTATPQSIAQGAQAMGRHMGLTDTAVEAALPSMAFWQMFLPAVLGRDPANFTDVGARLPRSLEVVRRGVVDAAAHPQLVFAAFHMAAFPLVAALLTAAVHGEHGKIGHVLVARRNMGWLRLDAGRWVSDAAGIISTDPKGLRQLHAGLRDGSIRRLLIMVDGPHRPGPGTHPLSGVSATLGFKTGLLRRLLALNIPVLPITHAWESDRLVAKCQPLIHGASPEAGVRDIAALIEGLLHRHPEQWLNWGAASIRTGERK